MKKLSACITKIFAPSMMLCALLVATKITQANDRHISFDTASIIGRWDITMHMADKEVPSWLEVQRSGLHTLVGHFVGGGGGARPISKVNFFDGKISFSIPPQWEVGNDLSFEATLQGDSLVGTIVLPNGKSYNCSATRAPSLRRESQPSWGKPIHLFNGKDLTGWHPTGQTNQWKAEGGILKSEKSGSNIVTDATFNDFKLHIEFRYPKGSNSGVYLRGRYEVQIEDDNGSEPYRNVFSGIYGFIAPAEITTKGPGEWNMYDITLVGRFVTIVANGKTVICSQEIPGITGGALNSKEGEPGPIYLQGDHGPIEYRNIILTPAK
jgi:3-keto-disaccharide hydrolase